MDPRISIIDKRLARIKKIIAVSGGKGGVGKSSVSTSLALCLSELGFKTGLLDLDLSGHSTHIILNPPETLFSKEEKGVVPPEIHGIKYMTAYFFAKKTAAPFRGQDITNAIIEILTITIWDELDYLIIDMPPGIGDTVLDVIRLLKNISFVLVTIPSKIAYEIMEKEISILSEINIPIAGIIENFHSGTNVQINKTKLDFIGVIPFDIYYESAVGDIDKIKKTDFYKSILNISKKIL